MEDGFSSYSSLYDTSSLLQFCNDDSASATSSMEVTDRLASLEQRVQMQEDEIQLLKSALADVVRRLNTSEEQHNLQTRRGPTKARPMIPALPLRPTVNNGTVLPKKGGGTLPSPSGGRKDSGPPSNKSLSSLSSLSGSTRLLSIPLSTVRRANSNEQVGTGTRKDSGDGKNNRTRAGSTGSNSSGKRISESKPKEPVFSTGMRRVTHCKVTVQIYLSRASKRAGPADTPKSCAVAVSGRPALPTTPMSKAAPLSEKVGAKAPVRKPPTFTLPLKKSTSQSYSPVNTPSYRSPIKSPSQYFQICY